MANARLELENQTIELPVVTGTMGEQAIDITNLRKDSGFITLDSGYQNTGSCKSSITYIDGDKGILKYRGVNIEDLAANARFTEVAYFLVHGRFATPEEKSEFSQQLTENSMLHEDMIRFFHSVPPTAHPMSILSTMVNAMSVFYPQYFVDENDGDRYNIMASRLISKIRTIAAFSYKRSIGEPLVYPRHDLPYCSNFLNMMFDSPVKPYQIDPETERLLNMMLIIHADHEQNCSTSTVRLVGSSKVNPYSSVCAGICALWGPLHGGANQEVIEMLDLIHREKLPIKSVIEKSKDKNSGFKLSGFGHRVYRNFDPRMKILKKEARSYLSTRGLNDPLMHIALELEEAALKDDYFIERKLYPNVDFYSGILYRAMGFPTEMFTVLFAMGRMPGWIAQWKEMHDSIPFKIGRPRQIYTGPTDAKYPGNQ
ncbi:citrate synthase [Oceanispirochaeta crateris]|uniref:Citrate synthase n=1 Tax=Oceanispirochaeta crateris TaxID=2518645 RepID=A0A5C1QU50_9SPIO|nr:citrate synthase [Oceanispirochaeta crateris]QEN09572.1 citrate synthase [Oceanispirochaeta crateris]